MELTRRGFLAGVGTIAGATALGLTGCAPSQPGTSAEDDGLWDKECDVLVVGAGGAGLTAALVAARGGAQVLVLEAATAAGGNTALSSGVIQAAGTPEQIASGIEDDTPEKHAEYYVQCGRNQLDPELIEYLCQQAPKAIEFMKELGISYDTVYANGQVPFVDESVQRARIHLNSSKDADGNGFGAAHVAALLKACEEKGVEFAYSTEASTLVNADGTITGVIDSKNKRYHGKKATILATCSFDRSADLARSFSSHMTTVLSEEHMKTAPTNLGQGIIMGMSVGAALDGLGGAIGLTNNVGATPTLPSSPEVGGVMVNRYGHRFVAESDHYAWVVQQIYAQESNVAWAVFDAHTAEIGPKKVGSGVSGMGDSWDEEIAKGMVLAADTLEQLAEMAGINAKNLAHTIETWNADMAQPEKKDSQFPTRRCGLEPISSPPYYAMRCYDYNLGALGGLRINTDAQVLDTEGKPIPHLYAAGQVAGGLMASFYPGTGTGVLTTLVFGRTAGEKALAESEA